MSDLLEGIRVVELGLFALVPAAAAVLAEWGADVVKIEHPEQGDPVRGLAAWGITPGTGGFSYMWEVCNKGKRSVGVDVAHELPGVGTNLQDRYEVGVISEVKDDFSLESKLVKKALPM